MIGKIIMMHGVNDRNNLNNYDSKDIIITM